MSNEIEDPVRIFILYCSRNWSNQKDLWQIDFIMLMVDLNHWFGYEWYFEVIWIISCPFNQLINKIKNVLVWAGDWKNKNILRTIWASNHPRNKNTEPQKKITCSYKNKWVYIGSLAYLQSIWKDNWYQLNSRRLDTERNTCTLFGQRPQSYFS